MENTQKEVYDNPAMSADKEVEDEIKIELQILKMTQLWDYMYAENQTGHKPTQANISISTIFITVGLYFCVNPELAIQFLVKEK